MFLRIFLFISLLLVHTIQAANPISIPIIQNAINVRIRQFAQLPRTDGSPAKILAMVPLGRDLIVVTLKIIYRVKPNGSVSVFLNVQRAFQQATGRKLNTDNRAHGGVRSIAFHPRFSQNRLCYIAAMEQRPGNTGRFKYISNVRNPIAADSVLVEFRVGRNPDVPIVGTYRNVFRIGMPVFDHPIKQISFFGNLLYVAHGDGSVQSATAGGGQQKDALGKILRINPLRNGNQPYTIPRSNPFVGRARMLDEVWAYGFRNPHHICFGRTGRLFVADAGRDNIEEVNLVLKGKNYGWSEREGTFVHLARGGLIRGIANLPGNDASNNYEYPVVQIGHQGRVGAGFVGQAIAGGCPIENGSPLSGTYFYSDFPISGKLYFSRLGEMYRARTRGNPNRLTQARTRQAVILFDHDNNPRTPPRRFATMRDVLRADPQFSSQERVDVRIGRGSRGEMYLSSKRNGRIYLVTNSLG